MTRRVIEVDGLGHGDHPIPLAVRKGPLLISGSISGRDRETGKRPDSPAEELANAFDNMSAVLHAGDADLDSVVKVDVALASMELRSQLNDIWTKTFPDPHDRPVRHTVASSLPGDLRIQIAVLAYTD